MLRWPYVQVRFPNGLPGAALPFGVIRRILPARELAVLRAGRHLGVAGRDEQVPVRGEQQPTAVMMGAGRDAGQHGMRFPDPSPGQAEPDDPVVGTGRAVRVQRLLVMGGDGQAQQAALTRPRGCLHPGHLPEG